MRSIDSKLDRFCYKHPRFSIPNLMIYLVIGNVAVFLLDMFSRGSFSPMLTFLPYAILHGQIWRIFTFVFVPLGGSAFSVALSLYFYYLVGTTLEREWGSTKFTVFYAMGVLLNVVAGFVLYFLFYAGGPVEMLAVTTSINYLNLSLFFAFATLYPNVQFLLFFLIPVKAKWMAWFDGAIFLWGVISSLMQANFVGAILPIVAILNYVLFFWSDLMDVVGRFRHRTSRQTVNFKQATRTAKETKGYIHKCAVCGKTDTDYPNMDFRYCSKCNGYYCYCSEHISNHVHVE